MIVEVVGIDVVCVDGGALLVMPQLSGGAGDMPPPSNIAPVEPLAGVHPLEAPGLMPGAVSSNAPSGMPACPADARGSVARGAIPSGDGSAEPDWAWALFPTRAPASREMTRTNLFMTSPRRLRLGDGLRGT